jgi:hypothetical protein
VTSAGVALTFINMLSKDNVRLLAVGWALLPVNIRSGKSAQPTNSIGVRY